MARHDLFLAHGAPVGHRERQLVQPARLGQPFLRFVDRRQQRRALNLQITIVEAKQRAARRDLVAGPHRDCRDDARHRRADGDAAAKWFDDAGAGDEHGERRWRHGRQW